jgi:hypothetical protein
MSTTDDVATLPTTVVRETRAATSGTRDPRLDFFRGAALFFIFFNHIPDNTLSWLTNRAWGFSDATEIFVFVSGYAAVLAYGGVAQRRGYGLATARIMRRVWQLYAAHLLLFLAFIAQIAYLSSQVGNPIFNEEMEILDFIRDPHIMVLQAILLRFRPVNMDVLPLYIVLLASLPLYLWALPKRPLAVLAVSLVVYCIAWFGGVNLPAWPSQQGWYFNPVAWQFLFVLGAVAGSHNELVRKLAQWRRVLVPLCIAFLLFSVYVVQSWNFTLLDQLMPRLLARAIYPIDKTNLDLLRAFHFLALAYLVALALHADSPIFRQRWVQPFIVAGRHSLYIFCAGIFLSFTGHFLLVEISSSVVAQILVSLSGLAIMVAMAYGLDWYRRAENAADRGRKA